MFRGLIPVLLLLAIFYSAGWIVLTILLLSFGIQHPRPIDGATPLDAKRRVAAVCVLLVFVLSFVPAPFPGGSLVDDARQALREIDSRIDKKSARPW